MNALACENCGATAIVRKNGYWICPYCDSHFVVAEGERKNGLLGNDHQSALSHSGAESAIALDDDVQMLLNKCKTDSRNARKYANLILDIDPDNEEALKYI
ncbi:MAG: hypothetical protein IJP38_09500 [Oscillospiraceae bacterium]|nr:hypothetical protein [Oscillospiraceae bacterium]